MCSKQGAWGPIDLQGSIANPAQEITFGYCLSMKNEQVERGVWAGEREEGGPKGEAVNRMGDISVNTQEHNKREGCEQPGGAGTVKRKGYGQVRGKETGKRGVESGSERRWQRKGNTVRVSHSETTEYGNGRRALVALMATLMIPPFPVCFPHLLYARLARTPTRNQIIHFLKLSVWSSQARPHLLWQCSKVLVWFAVRFSPSTTVSTLSQRYFKIMV